MDVWFDSGISWSSLPESENEGVSDIYLEGVDQVRDSNLQGESSVHHVADLGWVDIVHFVAFGPLSVRF